MAATNSRHNKSQIHERLLIKSFSKNRQGAKNAKAFNHQTTISFCLYNDRTSAPSGAGKFSITHPQLKLQAIVCRACRRCKIRFHLGAPGVLAVKFSIRRQRVEHPHEGCAVNVCGSQRVTHVIPAARAALRL